MGSLYRVCLADKVFSDLFINKMIVNILYYPKSWFLLCII